MKLDVYLRTCSRRGVHQNKRIVGCSREDMIKKCFLSLLEALEYANGDNSPVKLWIIDDNSSEEFVEWMKGALTYCTFEYSLQTSDEPLGYHESAVRQFELARKTGSDLIYLVEDDYFHSEIAVGAMVEAMHSLYGIVSQSPTHTVAIFPYDCIDRYHRDFPEPSRIFYGDGIYWRTVTKSSNTVMMPHAAFVAGYEKFDYLAHNFNPDGSCDEDTTINKLYGNMVTHGGPIILFSPIPSLAVHIEYKEPTSISNSAILDFYSRWNVAPSDY